MAKSATEELGNIGKLVEADAVDRVRELFCYDPDTGIFTWRVDRIAGNGARRFLAGSIAGSLDPSGYVKLWYDGKHRYAHRTAWLYVHGCRPRYVDHINGCKSDNRIANLRECTQSKNLANARMHKTNKSGFKGVCWHKDAKKWVAQIKVDGKRIYLGLFENVEAAHAAYKDAAVQAHGRFARV